MWEDINIIGSGMTLFGKHLERTEESLAQEAIGKAIVESGIQPAEIEAVFCGNVFGQMLPGQRATLGMDLAGPPVFNINNACASSSTALHMALMALNSGVYETVCVLGVDQLSRFGGGTLPLNNEDWNISRGLTMPANYAMRAQRYMHENNVGAEVLAQISVKNHDHGILNPYAQYKKAFTIEEVLESRMIAEPLTLLQCCPSTADGAASLILTTKKVNPSNGAVKIRASVIQSGLHETGCEDITHAEITRRTAQKAYEQAGLGPDDIHLVETHDAFTISELLYYEALGFCESGEAPRMVLEKETEIGGRIPFCPSGGLLSKGHPPGATGVAQMVEAVEQLQNRAGKRQVDGAKTALTHCTGGGVSGTDHAAASVHILEAVG